MIRNRFKVKEKSEEDVVTPPLLNEYAWDALAIAKKKLQMIPNDGQPQKPLTRAEQIKVDRFKRKVENAQYSRLCSRSRPIQAKKQERPIRELADSFGPFITVLVTIISCFIATEYFLKFIIHDFAFRFAIGVVCATLLAVIEIIFILKKFDTA